MDHRLIGPGPGLAQGSGHSGPSQDTPPPPGPQTQRGIEFGKPLEVIGTGGFMNSKDRRFSVFDQCLGHRLVGRQHGLLHRPVSRPAGRPANIPRPPRRVENHFGGREIEIQGQGSLTPASQPTRHLAESAQLLSQLPVRRANA